MNNLNDPVEWNIRPNERAGSDGNKWNYAFLVPILGLAAFRWIWSKESQKEVLEAKEKYEKEMKILHDNLTEKYRKMLKEKRLETLHLELNLEKERSRAHGYRQALASQSQQLQEERGRLQQERASLAEDKGRLLQLGPSGALFHSILEREAERQPAARSALREVENGLVERQKAFCSLLVPREKRLNLERELLARACRVPALRAMGMEDDLRDIFRNDRHCAQYLNTDSRRNGKLMWLYLRYWETQVTLQTHQRAESSILGERPNNQ